MKISPIAAAPAPVGAASAAPHLDIRSIKMNTNATPGRAEAVQEPSIPDTIDPAPAEDEVTQPLSPQFAALAKQRRALQVKEREIADREKALQSQIPTQGNAIALDRLKSDPLGVLLESGVTYEQLTEAVLSRQDDGNIDQRLKKVQEDFDKKLSDRDAQTEQQVLAEMKREASQLIAQGDDFELVRETRSLPQVMDLIEKTYRADGEVLDIREALKLVEDELFKESIKLANLKKVQASFAPQPALPPPQLQRQMRTLTNRDTAAVPMSAKQRALAAFNGTLRR